MLFNGNPPSSISKNLESTVRLSCPNSNAKELRNADHIIKMRGIIRIITESLAAYELSNNKEWKQHCNDGTSRCTTSMRAFGSSMMKNYVILPMLLSCSHVGLGKNSEDIIDFIREVISNGKVYLTMWSKECERLCPLLAHDFPRKEAFSLLNCFNAALANDVCNQACKTRRLLKAGLNEQGESKNSFNHIANLMCPCSCE